MWLLLWTLPLLFSCWSPSKILNVLNHYGSTLRDTFLIWLLFIAQPKNIELVMLARPSLHAHTRAHTFCMLKEKHLGWQVIAGSDVSEGRWPPTLQQSLVFLQSMPLVCFCFYFSQKKQSSLTRAGENIQINEEDNEIRYFVLWTVCARISLVLPFPVLCMIVNIFRVLFIVGPHLPFGVFPIFCCFWPPTVSSVLHLFLWTSSLWGDIYLCSLSTDSWVLRS